MIVVYLIISIVVIVCLRMLLLSLLGQNTINNLRAKDLLMECRNGRLADAYSELGISIIINDLEKYEDMTALLSLELNRYEVIVMLDFSTHALGSEIVHDFDMLKIDRLPTRELSCLAIRGVYRARESRYSRLVVVDINKGSSSQRFNCGVNISRYEYVIAIESACRINHGALCSTIRTIMEQDEEQKVCAVGGFRIGETPKNPLSFIDMSIKSVITGACQGSFTHWGRDLSIVFDREYLIQAGGYGIDKEYDYELFMRIKRMNERTKDSALSILMPKVFLFDREAKGLKYSKSMLTSSFVFGFLFILSLLCIMTQFTVMMLLCFGVCYLSSVCVALICINSTSRMYKFHSTLLLLFSLILYPFYLIFRLFRKIRF